jgi:formylglycine-generating enzyme required for sulfatase activity
MRPARTWARVLASAAAWSGWAACLAAAAYVRLPGGEFMSALSVDGSAARIRIEPFSMRTEPVTNDEFLAFVRAHPAWRRGQVSPLFAGPRYLASWAGPLTPGPTARPAQPVTDVSWFAAREYCASEHARLPTWYEWEYAAAADATRTDARQDPARNQRVLSAILADTGARPADIGREPPDVYGIADLNTLLWEWTEDYAAMFPNADARVPGAAANLALCGGSALAFADKNQYALMMRVAALSALRPVDDAPRVGFRCVRDASGE